VSKWLSAIGRGMQWLSASRVNYWVSYVADAAMPFAFLYLGSQFESALPRAMTMASVGAGVFAFTLIEYAVHRWLFHWKIGFMVRIHDVHHCAPTEPAALPFFCAPGALVVLWVVFAMLFGAAAGSYFVAGISAGYFWYALLHHMEHSAWIHRPALRWLRKRYGMHVIHHQRDKRNYGVTTSLWDHVFGTHYLANKR